MKIEIQLTADGSKTFYLPDIDEHYHSVKGAFTESQHVFIQSGLMASCASEPHVLEVGFGSGMNAYLTYRYAHTNSLNIHYTTYEKYPLSYEQAEAFISGHEEASIWMELHRCKWDTWIDIDTYFHFRKKAEDMLHADFEPIYDVIYMDAFSPEKQPEMWTETFLKALYAGLRPRGILTTYCAKGVIRRRLQEIGFRVERLSGPPQGKREILRAVKE